MDVTRIGGAPIGAMGGPAAPGTAGAATGSAFGQLLKESLNQVNSLQHEADRAIQSLASGGTTTLHDTMLAIEKAELSFKLMMQIRNKIVEAYQEVLRMQV